MSEIPPATQDIIWSYDDPFSSNDDVVYSSCKLYVPAGSIDAYKAEDVWGKFANIEGFTDTPTGVNNVPNADDNSATRKMLHDGKLIIRKAGKTYDLRGTEVK